MAFWEESSGSGLALRPARIAVALVALALVIFAVAPAANAQADEFDITIPVDTIVFADEGSITPLESVNVPADAEGQTCEVRAESQNPDSVHPGNNLIVESGITSVVLEGVEDEPASTVEGSGFLTLGPTITVALQMGPDEVFSAGINVVVDCSVQPTTTTMPTTTSTLPDTTTTQILPSSTVGPTTTIPSTSTTAEVLPTSITVAPSSSVAPSTLPFTGGEPGTPALLAVALLGAGALALLFARRAED